ncbi:MAG: sulfurtransferase TusA family protein [Thermodesulfobacteriota bacterium]|nr:sulfurtransferase TusA family protein [Thermodesulfobacteriota bacterium]
MACQLDLRGMISPITLLKVTQAFRGLDPGETLEIVGSDAQTRKDLFKVLEAPHYELVKSQDDRACYRIVLRKRA